MTKLSENLKQSAEETLRKHLEHHYVTKFLTSPYLTLGFGNPSRVAMLICQFNMDSNEVWQQVYTTAAQKTDNENEKELFENISKRFQEAWGKWIKNHNEKFGPIDKRTASRMMNESTRLYNGHFLNVANNGSMLELLVALFGTYYSRIEVNRSVESHPDFEPNIYFDQFSYGDFDMKGMSEQFIAMIDARDKDLSDEEVNLLCDHFKKSLENEIRVADAAIRG